MNIVWSIAGLVGFVAFAVYVRLPQWFSIPKDPWAPKLETDTYPYLFFPPPLLFCYEHNLAWRRNVALRRQAKRDREVGMMPYSGEDVANLEGALGRPLDSDMRANLTNPNI
jgi:hypothetical protein